jgi:hypothetical protein
MGEAKQKSKRQSSGKQTAQQRLRSSSVFYLDENLSECQPVHAALNLNGILFERHFAHFPRTPPTPDHVWLDFAGRHGWIVLTKDKSQRFVPLERAQIEQHKIRQFAFSSGNINGQDMADMFVTHLRKIFSVIKRQQPPFIMSITKTGVYLRFPKPTDEALD